MQVLHLLQIHAVLLQECGEDISVVLVIVEHLSGAAHARGRAALPGFAAVVKPEDGGARLIFPGREYAGKEKLQGRQSLFPVGEGVVQHHLLKQDAEPERRIEGVFLISKRVRGGRRVYKEVHFFAAALRCARFGLYFALMEEMERSNSARCVCTASVS